MSIRRVYTTGDGVRAARVQNGDRRETSGQGVEEEEGEEERTRSSSVM